MTPATVSSDVAHAHASMQRALIAGVVVLAVLILGLMRWAALTEITGAVIAEGTVVVESSLKKIQHPSGGTVKEVRVRNGDRIKSGEILIRLDGGEIENRLKLLERQLLAHRLRIARLTAERDNQASIGLPGETIATTSDAEIGDMIASETNLFESRRAVREGQRAELNQRILQFRNEITGLVGQSRAKAAEIRFIEEELRLMGDLEPKGVDQSMEIRNANTGAPGTAARRLALNREAARLRGERGQIRAATAQLRGRIAEIEMQLVRLDHEARSAVIADLAATTVTAAEIKQQALAAADALRRLDIEATTGGIVHELAVRGSGDVIGAGETLMRIIPEGDRLVVEARIDPHQIDQILASKTALLRFSSFNQRTTPELAGTLTRVSADLSRDTRTGAAYFIARVEIEESELGRLGGTRLVPGMPLEVQIETQNRTALSYLLKPLEDQLARAWKER